MEPSLFSRKSLKTSEINKFASACEFSLEFRSDLPFNKVMLPRSSHPRQRLPLALRRVGAFTAVELMVALSVIAILTATLYPALQRARRQAQAGECVSKLRWMGIAITHHATDHQGWVVVYGPVRWYYPVSGIRDAIRNPNEPWTKAAFDRIACSTGKTASIDGTYGLHLNTQTHDGLSKMEMVGDPPLRQWSDRILMRPNPQSYPFLADTAVANGLQAGYFYPRTDGSGWARLCARHNGRANIWFVDGHIESCDEDRLRTLNVRYLRDNEGNEKRLQ